MSTAAVSLFAVAAVREWLKSELDGEGYRQSPSRYSWKTNSQVNAVSLVTAGYLLTVSAAWLVEHAVVKDLKTAAKVTDERRTTRPLSYEDADIGRDGLLGMAIAWQVLQPGPVCAGLSEKDGVALLPGGQRAFVRHSATFHPTKSEEVTMWPLADVDIIDCKRDSGPPNASPHPSSGDGRDPARFF
jgi:hypothetical protein